MTLTKSSGSQPVIFFERERAIGYDQSLADTGNFKAEKEANFNIIHSGKAFIGILLKIVFMAEIKIISQPFHIILMHGRM